MLESVKIWALTFVHYFKKYLEVKIHTTQKQRIQGSWEQCRTGFAVLPICSEGGL